MSYDAFISYSHSADGLLAPAVQEGMQKLAKPWNKRRALRVFRDDTGLSANPALWTSIVAALDESSWFVLFLSPAAANSEWVDKEVAHWLANHPRENILPVLTEGDLVWDTAANDFDATASSAVPPSLFGALSEEPRHLDLRWAHDEDQLELRNTRFRDAIADLAAPVHGIAKEDLEGEDVRLHRRARRLARTAVAALVVLLAASIAAMVFAFSEASRADEAAEEARSEAERARQAEVVAEEERADADDQRKQAEDALARALSAEELADLEAERALDEQARAEEQTVIAESERGRAEAETVRAEGEAVRAERAAMCSSYNQLIEIEQLRFLPVAELYAGPDNLVFNGGVNQENRQSVALQLHGELRALRLTATSTAIDGYTIVAMDGLKSSSWGLWTSEGGRPEDYFEELPPGGFLDDPSIFTWNLGYEAGGYDYYDLPVDMSYGEAVAEIESTIGGLCREVGL